MPGNVASPDFGSPVRVMPKILAAAFREARSYDGLLNTYADGSRQAMTVNANSVRSFEFTSRDQAGALRAFFNSTKHQAFYFYDPKQGVFDATGANTTGRIGCVFERFSETTDMIATQSISIREVA